MKNAKNIKPPSAEHLPSGQWRCRIRIGGKDYSITKPTEAEAVAEAMAIKYGIIKKGGSQKIGITVRKAIDKYIAARPDLSPSTVAAYRVIQKNRMPQLMDREIGRITLGAIQRSMDAEAKRLKPKTIANTYGLLRAVMDENGSDIDWSRLRRPKPQKAEKVIYQEDEIKRLMEALDGSEIEVPVLLALMLGLRRSEICALQWSDIDLNRKTIHVRRAMVVDENRQLVTKGTKTLGSDRVIPNCPQYLMSRIAELPTSRGTVFGFSPEALSKRFDKLLRDNGLPHIGLHALRHTWASVMLNLGANDKTVMALGGWTTAATMKGIYQHAMDSGMKKATDSRNSFFDSLAGGQERIRIVRSVGALEDDCG